MEKLNESRSVAAATPPLQNVLKRSCPEMQQGGYSLVVPVQTPGLDDLTRLAHLRRLPPRWLGGLD
jgi:hypothetical protein